MEVVGEAPGDDNCGEEWPVVDSSNGRVWPFVSSGAADDSTSLSNDWRKLGPLPGGATCCTSSLCRLEDPGTGLRVAGASAGASDEDSATSNARLVLGLLSGRCGSEAGSVSRGEVVGDFRFLLLDDDGSR